MAAESSGNYLTAPLQANVLETLPTSMGTCDAESVVETFLKTTVETKKIEQGVLRDLRKNVIMMSAGKRKRRQPHQRPFKRKITSKEAKQLGIYDIPKEELKYDLYLALHRLWCDYVTDLLQLDREKPPNTVTMATKMTRADYHGSLLKVARSKCPSYVGLKGIVLQETLNTFKLISSDNKLRTIPKGGSVFSFTLHGFEFCIHGNHIKHRASERSSKKFKDKQTIEL